MPERSRLERLGERVSYDMEGNIYGMSDSPRAQRYGRQHEGLRPDVILFLRVATPPRPPPTSVRWRGSHDGGSRWRLLPLTTPLSGVFRVPVAYGGLRRGARATQVGICFGCRP